MRYIFPARIPDPRDFAKPVHDGDTLWLTLDKGHRDKPDKDIRLKGVFAPENSKPGGAETHRVVLDWLDLHTAAGKWPLSVETFATRTGNDIVTLARFVGMVYAGDPEDVRTKAMPCLNTHITAWLATQDPAWGGGIGSRFP